MTDGEKTMGLLIALMGAEVGRHHIGQYGAKGDASPKHVLNDDGVRRILELDEAERRHKKP